MVPHEETVNRAYQAGIKDANDRIIGEANRLEERKMVEDQAVNMAQQAQQAGFQQGHEAGANQVASELMGSIQQPKAGLGDADGTNYGNPEAEAVQIAAEAVVQDPRMEGILGAIAALKSGNMQPEEAQQVQAQLQQVRPQLEQQLGPQAGVIVSMAADMKMQDINRVQTPTIEGAAGLNAPRYA